MMQYNSLHGHPKVKRKRKRPVTHPENASGLLRRVYDLIGLALAPVCFVAGRTLWRMIGSGATPFQNAAASTPAMSFGAGIVLWLFVYGLMPRPVKLYVLGHEVTHAMAAWLSGGSARKMRVGTNGGSVAVTKTNLFVVLAPYFFPFYAAVLMAAYFAGALFFDPEPWYAWWMAGLGISWGFHLTFTCSALAQPQSDVSVYGPILSYSIILLFNMLILALGLVCVATPSLEEFAGVFREEFIAVTEWPQRIRDMTAAWPSIYNIP